MKKIDKINEIRSNYDMKDVGKDHNVADIPFFVRAGMLNHVGEIENAGQRSTVKEFTAVVIPPSTNAQEIVRLRNKYYKRCLVHMYPHLAITSLDYEVRASYANGISGTIDDGLGNTLGGMGGVANNERRFWTLSVPYGEEIEIVVIMDNNHAVDDATVSGALILYDPIR